MALDATGEIIVSQNQDKSVMEFQAKRASGAPRRWTYWIAVFTAVNGALLLAKQDLTFLVGLVAPFALSGALPHFIAAAVLAAIAYLSTKYRGVLLVGLLLYVADTLFSAYLNLWSGVIMHVVVMALTAIAIAAGRRLKTQLAGGSGV